MGNAKFKKNQVVKFAQVDSGDTFWGITEGTLAVIHEQATDCDGFVAYYLKIEGITFFYTAYEHQLELA